MLPPRPEGIGVAVEFSVEEGLTAGWDEPRIAALVSSIISAELPSVPARYVIGLHLVGDATIRALNDEHRGVDAHTDVLSFPLLDPTGVPFVVPPHQPRSLGDVVISYPRAVEQALEFGHSADREIGYLVAHGVLHVLGYDHEDDADRVRMRQREEEALRPLGFIR
jgi:probable rRNA maturation factor